jgi:hypothetical protein
MSSYESLALLANDHRRQLLTEAAAQRRGKERDSRPAPGRSLASRFRLTARTGSRRRTYGPASAPAQG